MSGDSPSPDEENSKRDPMGPPLVECECSCLHCGRTFMSGGMWLQRVIGDPSGFPGFWKCPTPNCSGAGFTIDIFPTDPGHPANDGWHFDDDDLIPYDDDAGEEETGEWDPMERKYKALDAELEDDDLEGEEWKHGLQPGERPEPEWMADARRQEEERQREFDGPDLRPREVQWKPQPPRPEGPLSDDEIPF